MILLATSKGRKAIHPPASGPESRSEGAGATRNGTKNLAAAYLFAACKRRQRNPHFTPMREGARTLPPRGNHAMRLRANFLLKDAICKRARTEADAPTRQCVQSL